MGSPMAHPLRGPPGCTPDCPPAGLPPRHRPGTGAPQGYERHRPELTALYQLLEDHWPSFLERAEEAGGLPRFIGDEVRAYLRCGILEHGGLELVCRHCGHSRLVAFSCKCRGFCPSCMGRRMADMGVHLEESVLPPVPVRHWIVTFPWGLRALLGYARDLCAEVVAAFAKELQRSLKWRAKALLGLGTVQEAFTGLVVAVQRSDSALRLNVHLHVLALDGVYVRDGPGDALLFHPLPTPCHAEVAATAARTAARLDKLLNARGRSLEPCSDDDAPPPELVLDEPGLALCYEVAARGVSLTGERAGQPTLRLIVPHDPPPPAPADLDRPVAEVRGINIYAKQLVDGRDRKQLERLCRTITRPPIAQDRLELRSDGRYLLTFKSVWKDGTRGLLFEPHDLIARLVAAIPPPRFHRVRYFGVLSSHSSVRGEVVPKPVEKEGEFNAGPAKGDQLELVFPREEGHEAETAVEPTERAGRRRWAWLLRHVFREDVETCERCGGPMRWAEVADNPEAIARLMHKHGLEARAPPPPWHPSIPLGQLKLKLG